MLTRPLAGRMYALEQGLAMADRSAETTALLGSVMQQLEARQQAYL